MNIDQLLTLFEQGKMSRQDVRWRLSSAWLDTLDGQIADVNRQLRSRIPEIIYGEYKTFQQIVELAEHTLSKNSNVIVSRASCTQELIAHFTPGLPVVHSERVLVVGRLPQAAGAVLLISGGTSDHAVVREIELVLQALGIQPLVYEDRGIAHPGRVVEAVRHGLKEQVRCVVAVAGMEASLATFVSALVPLPVIGVPTSVGYGYKAGESALISMLSSCTPNLAVVNIDGGVRAAVLAYLIGGTLK